MSNISENHHFNIVGEIQSAFGFYKFYFANLQFYSKQETCFQYCNQYFKNQFGYDRYDSWEEFRGEIGFRPMKPKLVKNIIPVIDSVSATSPIEIMEREFLISWFKHKGFDTWTSFKALVMHYYPALAERDVLNFWKGDTVVSDVLKCVSYVKQIIGE
jgi:hypothetical protein